MEKIFTFNVTHLSIHLIKWKIKKKPYIFVRERPFNLQGGLCFFFRTARELEYLFFLSHRAQIFFPEFNIRLYDKNSESDFFFSSTKIRIFFQQHWESEYFFRKKTIASSVKNGDTILIRLNIHVALHLFLWPILTPCKAPC